MEIAASGLTTQWSDISRNLNLTTTNSDIQGILVGSLLTYGLIVRVGFGLALLLVLNALIMCTLLITTGLKNMGQK